MDRPRSPDPPNPPPSGALNGKTPQFAGSCFVVALSPVGYTWAVKQEAEEGLSR